MWADATIDGQPSAAKRRKRRNRSQNRPKEAETFVLKPSDTHPKIGEQREYQHRDVEEETHYQSATFMMFETTFAARKCGLKVNAAKNPKLDSIV
jgi:hypothetical protein